MLNNINVEMKSEALKTIALIQTHRYTPLSITLYSQLTAFEIQIAGSSEVFRRVNLL